MTSGSSLPDRPQLRPVEVNRISHEGSDYFLLKDPRKLSEQSLLVSAPLGAYLQNVDGTHTVEEIIETALTIGAPLVPTEILDDLLTRLDEALLLSNGAYLAEMERRMHEYRSAPSRKAALADLAYPGNAEDLRRYLDGFVIIR